MVPQVFISYKREELELAEPLVSKLEEAGFDVWMDRNIQAGTEWREEIDGAIKESIALIVIMTPEAKASEYVTYEWAFAYGAGVRVIPFIYIEPEALHPRLGTLQYVKCSEAERWDKIVSSLREAQASYLFIHRATWGARDEMRDVTGTVREHVSAGRLEMQADIHELGEPARGHKKKLVIVYSCGGEVRSEELEEDEKLILPRQTG